MNASWNAIGFARELTPVTQRILTQALGDASKRLVCAAGCYSSWTSHSGGQLLFHYPYRAAKQRKAGADADTFHPVADLKGVTVSHRGLSAIAMRLAHSTPNSSRNPLEGVCVGTLASQRGKERSILFAFEHIGHALDPFDKPVTARVQVIGLAHKIWAYATEAELMRAMPSKRLIGRGALLPVTAEEVSEVELIHRVMPNTLWMATGVVKRSARLINPETNQPYLWLLLDTDRGEIDILASPDVVKGDVSTGHLLQTVISTTGRILERAH